MNSAILSLHFHFPDFVLVTFVRTTRQFHFLFANHVGNMYKYLLIVAPLHLVLLALIMSHSFRTSLCLFVVAWGVYS